LWDKTKHDIVRKLSQWSRENILRQGRAMQVMGHQFVICTSRLSYPEVMVSLMTACPASQRKYFVRKLRWDQPSVLQTADGRVPIRSFIWCNSQKKRTYLHSILEEYYVTNSFHHVSDCSYMYVLHQKVFFFFSCIFTMCFTI